MRPYYFILYPFLCLSLANAYASNPKMQTTATTPGYADLHNHMFAEHAFGGAWLHGSVEGDIKEALLSCDATFDPFQVRGTHGSVKIPLISKLIGRTLGSDGDTGSHSEPFEGYPSLKDWPRWDTIAHQQMWEGSLKEAMQKGLSLLVVSLVNFEPLCKLMPERNLKFKNCEDMVSLHKQIDAALRFQSTHDWFKIVTTPEEARTAIKQKKLAVVLSLEASHIFQDGPWEPEFEKAYDRGVRTFQIAHQLNNRFAGVAIHNRAFRAIQWLLDYTNRANLFDFFKFDQFGFQIEKGQNSETEYNTRGLTAEGQALILAMIKKGLPIDLAHLSEETVRNILTLTEKRGHYPVYVSHGHFREAMDDGKFSVYEKSSAGLTLDAIQKSQGIFGLRTGPEKTKTNPESPVPNDCLGSSKSFAQAYQYGLSKKISIGFGSDLNGFIQQTRPRFRENDETCSSQTNPLNRPFDKKGLGEIAALPDLLNELKNFKVNTTTLEHSTEDYIRMWERAVALSNKAP